LRVGVQFDAPLNRMAERNNYRQALIEYQQARRNYYTFIDRVSQQLRANLRSVDLNEANFELRRAAVRVAIDQVEITRLRLRQPPQPGVVATLSNTTARDLVSALSDLQNVQNDFLSVWVNNEVERLNLDFNMGSMQLDSRGMWIDPRSAVGSNALNPYGWLYGYGSCDPALWPSDGGRQRPPEEISPREPDTRDGQTPPALPPDLMKPPESLPPPERESVLPGSESPVVRLTTARARMSWPTGAAQAIPQELPKTDAQAEAAAAPSFSTGGRVGRSWPAVRPAAAQSEVTTSPPVATAQ
jgi:hypothetical protein